jgi:hypothetical protein
MKKYTLTSFIALGMQSEGNKYPEKWGTNRRFILHESAPVHYSVLVKDLLAKMV